MAKRISIPENAELTTAKEVTQIQNRDTIRAKTINGRIAELRKAKRLTQKEFAEKLNVSSQVVSKWENGDSVPSLEDAEKICKEFNLTLDYLIRGIESESDTEALKPVPPPRPPFADPVQELVKKIDEIIKKNKLQKYKEQIFPSSSVDAIYDFVERIRKDNLEKWEYMENMSECEYRYQFREKYSEDRRSSKKLIDEKYWGQASDDDGEQHELKCGIFILNKFSYDCEEIAYNKIVITKGIIKFGIDFNGLLALDNYEIYSKLSSLDIPLHFIYSKKPKIKTSSNYFNGISFEQSDYDELYIRLHKTSILRNGGQSAYEKICKCAIQSYKERLKDYRDNHGALDYVLPQKAKFYIRDLSIVPLTYKEILGLTDMRFFKLLKQEELTELLSKVNTKHKRVWEIITALIENGATYKDDISTLMLSEIAKTKLNSNQQQ